MRLPGAGHHDERPAQPMISTSASRIRASDGWKLCDARFKGGSLVQEIRQKYRRVRSNLTPVQYLRTAYEQPTP